MKRTSALIAAAALIMSAFAAAPASASTMGQSQTIAYGDLDLTSQAGADAMLGRMHHAARMACFDRHGAMPMTSRRAITRCRTTAMNNAVEALGAPMVTAMYYGQEPNIIVASR